MGYDEDWRAKYHAVLLELDPLRLRERIEETQAAMRSRLRELIALGASRSQEAHDLEDAEQNLRVLKRSLEERNR